MLDDGEDGREPDGTLTSKALADLIIDALLTASLVARNDLARAVALATEEIEARKALGDY